MHQQRSESCEPHQCGSQVSTSKCPKDNLFTLKLELPSSAPIGGKMVAEIIQHQPRSCIPQIDVTTRKRGPQQLHNEEVVRADRGIAMQPGDPML